MRLFLALFLVFSISFSTYTQDYAANNLVLNASFEQATNSDKNFTTTDVIESCQGWNSPNQGQASIFAHTSDGYVYDSYGASWNFKARTGKNVAGLNVYGDANKRRDYIQGTLTEPLEVGQKYYFSFWVHYHCQGANNIGITFLPKKIKVDSTGRLPLKPASYQTQLTPYNKENTWTLVRDSFVAYKAYESFIIGNFFTDDETKLESSKGAHYFAYIDDILVIKAENNAVSEEDDAEKKENWNYNEEVVKDSPVEVVEETIIEPVPTPTPSPEVKEEVLTEKKAYEFSNITFKHASYDLSDESVEILNNLIQLMQDNPDKRVIVKGFASSEGDEVYNRSLSGQRAQAVLNQLMEMGLDANRILTQALGEAYPVAPNDTEDNRQKNRRVELELLD